MPFRYLTVHTTMYILGGMKQQSNNFWAMRVTDHDRELIEALAKREGTSASVAVRAAIQKALKEERAPADKRDGALIHSGQDEGRPSRQEVSALREA